MRGWTAPIGQGRRGVGWRGPGQETMGGVALGGGASGMTLGADANELREAVIVTVAGVVDPGALAGAAWQCECARRVSGQHIGPSLQPAVGQVLSWCAVLPRWSTVCSDRPRFSRRGSRRGDTLSRWAPSSGSGWTALNILELSSSRRPKRSRRRLRRRFIRPPRIDCAARFEEEEP